MEKFKLGLLDFLYFYKYFEIVFLGHSLGI